METVKTEKKSSSLDSLDSRLKEVLLNGLDFSETLNMFNEMAEVYASSPHFEGHKILNIMQIKEILSELERIKNQHKNGFKIGL